MPLSAVSSPMPCWPSTRVLTPQIAWPAGQDWAACQEPQPVFADGVLHTPFNAFSWAVFAAVSSSAPCGASIFIWPPTNGLLTTYGLVTAVVPQLPQKPACDRMKPM